MTAYDLSEKKVQILRMINYLNGEIGTSAKEVCFSDSEVLDIVNTMNSCISVIDEMLKKR